MPYSEYLKAVQEKMHTQQASEHSYRGLLESLLVAHVPDIAKDRYKIINEPSRIACGAPDLAILQSSDDDMLAVGYVEAKDIGMSLDKEEKSEQLQRYRNGLENLILTDYLEFRLFANGEKVLTVLIAENINGVIKPLPESFEKLQNLFSEFFTNERIAIKSTEDLAKIMANKTKLMQDVFNATLTHDANSVISQQHKAFKTMLISDLTPTQFADIYAQTITYGLFTAKLQQFKQNQYASFTKKDAADFIPANNEFLQELFSHIADSKLDASTLWVIDNLCELFTYVEWKNIIKTFSYENESDPIIHFYENFLTTYNPELRKARGVWYTPQSVVQFIVRAVDDCLQTHFNLPKGLADSSMVDIATSNDETKAVHKVQLLDVATGTGTFLAETIQRIYRNHFSTQSARWSNYVEQNLLPRLHGFEILMAPYAICHLNIQLLLEELGYKSENQKRLGVYLTNTLEEYHDEVDLPFANWLAEESNQASRIKREMPVMVAFGNPPYSGESQNKSDFIMNLMQDYKKEPSGGKLKEKNPKWINDDYVKFIRMGEHYINKNNEGILAYISNHSYIDNPTFRGVRFHLLNTFDEIYILDLHGNAKKKEKAPDGKPDKNVFNIEQGAAIIIAIKLKHEKKELAQNKLAQVFHADLWGSDRKEKYDWLKQHSLHDTDWQTVNYQAPYYFFCPKDFKAEKKYQKGFQIKELFPVNSVGIVTARDSLTIDKNRTALTDRLEDFLTLSDEQARMKFNLGKDTRDWTVSGARQDLKKLDLRKTKITPINYRPFDSHFTYYTGKSKGFYSYPRNDVMQHMLVGDNIGLTIGRQGQVVGSMQWSLAFISNSIIDLNLYYRGGANLFPLYLYDTDSMNFGKAMRRPNLNQTMIDAIAKILKITFIPDHEDDDNADDKTTFNPLDILDYIYAVLHSPAYRATYQEFLKIDFPHIPYPQDAEQFWQLVALGEQIRKLHLLQHPLVHQPITKWEVTGSDIVEKPIYKDGRIYINAMQYFDDAPEIAWQFYIGGYQPAQKWLKDRKGKKLDDNDIEHYQQIIIALAETHRLMQEIDKIH